MNNKSGVSFDDNNLEKEVQNALNGPDVQQQIRASIGSLPGDIQFNQSMHLTRKRSWIRSKMPLRFFSFFVNIFLFFHNRFFRKSENSSEPAARSMKIFDIYKFADRLDIILMIIGSIAG